MSSFYFSLTDSFLVRHMKYPLTNTKYCCWTFLEMGSWMDGIFVPPPFFPWMDIIVMCVHWVGRVNKTLAYRDPRYYRCCSGFCIDLLQKFADDLKFSYELNRVEDGTWGALIVRHISLSLSLILIFSPHPRLPHPFLLLDSLSHLLFLLIHWQHNVFNGL